MTTFSLVVVSLTTHPVLSRTGPFHGAIDVLTSASLATPGRIPIFRTLSRKRHFVEEDEPAPNHLLFASPALIADIGVTVPRRVSSIVVFYPLYVHGELEQLRMVLQGYLLYRRFAFYIAQASPIQRS